MRRLAVALLALAVSACSSGGGKRPTTTTANPEPAAPVQPSAPQAESPPPSAPVEPAEPEQTEVSGAYGPKTVVIDDPQVEETEPTTLAEAARKAKEARGKEGEPIAVITDETLPEYATGELSLAEEKPGATGSGASPASPKTAAESQALDEEFWRERVRGARMRWRDLVEEITRLEGRVGELRQRFYAEDDGFYRDSQIKPAWDRALDLLAETRDEARRAQENLVTVLQEGRLAGALPGWLREGIEYEPAVEQDDEDLDIHEATEPKVVDEAGNGDGDGR